MAALNGNAVTESSGLRILVGAGPEIHLADALARHLLEGAEHSAGAHGRLQLFIGHLAALGLDPDLFKNVNPEAFVTGICFSYSGLTSSKITALSVVLSAEA